MSNNNNKNLKFGMEKQSESQGEYGVEKGRQFKKAGQIHKSKPVK